MSQGSASQTLNTHTHNELEVCKPMFIKKKVALLGYIISGDNHLFFFFLISKLIYSARCCYNIHYVRVHI